MIRKLNYIVILYSLQLTVSFGQSIVYPLMADIGLGTSTYHGDIYPGLSQIEPGANASVGLRFLMTRKISFNPQLQWSSISGNDANGTNPNRNLSFRSRNLDLALRLEYNFHEYHVRQESRPQVNPYFTFGFGGMFFDPQANYEGTWIDLQSLSTAGKEYSKFTAFIPVGYGMRFKINKKVSLILEYDYYFTFSDYIDDIGYDNYYDNELLTGLSADLADRSAEIDYVPTNSSDGIHWDTSSKRGNTKLTDSISHFSLKIEWYMDAVQITCPDF